MSPGRMSLRHLEKCLERTNVSIGRALNIQLLVELGED